MKKYLIILAVILLLLILYWAISYPFTSPGNDKKRQVFVVTKEAKETEIIKNLKTQGFVRFPWVFNLVMMIKGEAGKIQPGGYYLSPNMNAWAVAEKLTKPDLKWVTIVPGLRKEQIGEILAQTFNWSDNELNKWNTVYTRMKFDYREGVYFPDTYLIPISETGLEITKRMINRFNKKMEAYFPAFAKANIKWTTALKIASLIQREAGGKDDMPIIAGVIWNRLDKEMNLQIDAEIQYAKGKVGDQWWSRVSPNDLSIDSPYNSYLYKGLPPTPIANPGLEAIAAVLNSADTECLYYLHDHHGQIHCAKTYEEHQENIKEYL